MRLKEYLKRADSGMEAIEGLLVFTLMLFVLLYIWAFGFLLYQNWAVQYVANDAASRIAQTYGYDYSDPITGFVSREMRIGLSPYRYQNKGSDGIDAVNANRAEKYGEWSLKQTGFTKAMGMEVEAKTEYDSLAQRHVVVTVTGTYEIPFGFALKLFGQSPYRTFTATGRAICLDLQHYVYTIKTVDRMGSIATTESGAKIIKVVEKTISMVKSVGNWVQNITGNASTEDN